MKKYTGHIVSHTHWDREWYAGFEVFRARLVALMDGLLDLLEHEPRFRHFMLDGQTVVLDDYLEIRPERRAELERRVREGRIGVGPWYVLPDQFLVSGEALVRNLEIGMRRALAAGRCMRVGYLPDQFGHISQMPQILKGFGIENAVIWRGLNDRSLPSELLWEAPDGSRVLAHHLSIDMGYLNALRLPKDVKRAFARLDNAAEERKTRAVSPHLLIMNGVDHAPPDGHLPGMISALNRLSRDVVFRHSTLEDYFAAARKGLSRRLPVVRGELRDTAKDGAIAWVVQGVLSSRMYTKTANHHAQTLLEKWVEPISAMAWLRGAPYPCALIAHAWLSLLKNHPHDTIGGCSIDEVHRDMMSRYAAVDELGKELLQAGLRRLAGGGLLRPPAADTPQRLLVFNPLPRGRSEVVVADVLVPAGARPGSFIISDDSGREIPYQLVEHGTVLAIPEWNPDKFDACRCRVAFFAERVPGCGMRTYHLSFDQSPSRRQGTLLTGRRKMENEWLSVSISPDGSMEVREKETGRQWRGLNVFEDGGDAGDLYTYSPPHRERLIRSGSPRPRIRIVHDGPLFAEILISHRLALPAGLSSDGRGRSRKCAMNKIESRVRLCRGSRLVEIETAIENRSRDHRLRVLFPVGAGNTASFGQFDFIERPVGRVDIRGWIEQDMGTRPMQGCVDLRRGKGGLAVLSEGLAEYEAAENGTAAITLLRCVGAIQRSGLLARTDPPGATLSIPVPDAQCPGRHVFRYALFPHSVGGGRGGHGSIESSLPVPLQAELFHAPLRAFQAPADGGNSRWAAEGMLALDNPNVLASAIKKADGRGELIVRLVNTLDRQSVCRLRPGFKVAAAWATDLMERHRARLDCRELRFVLGPKTIRTIALRPAGRSRRVR